MSPHPAIRIDYCYKLSMFNTNIARHTAHVYHSSMIWYLTHWGRMTHICVSKLTSIGSDNGLSPGWHQAIIWTYAGILLIGPLGTDLSEILIEIYTFPFKKMHLNVSSGKSRPFRLGLNVLTTAYDSYFRLVYDSKIKYAHSHKCHKRNG